MAGVNPDAGIWLDAAVLEQDLDGAAWDPDTAEQVVALYHGDFLAGFSLRQATQFELWQVRKRERFHIKVQSELERLVEHHLSLDNREKGLFYTSRWLALEPLSETAHRQRMTLLAISGQREQALAQYDILEKILATELRVEPSAETVALRKRILAGDLDRPFRLGSYEIREKIGQGGMANVYRAYQSAVDRDVAVKVIRKPLDQDPDAIRRFQREARLIARLEHPHILPVYDFFSGRGSPYIVMRLVSKMTLGSFLAQGLPTTDELLRIIGQVGLGLDYAHRQGIIHRDIKPSNILIDDEGNSFLSDFGIAYILARHETGSEITAEGAVMGTPEYMSPEQITSDAITPASDIYSLGVVIFLMLTGTLPFADRNLAQLLLQHLRAPVPSVRAFNPELQPQLDAVLARAMAKEASDRYRAVPDLVKAVTAALGAGVHGSERREPTADRTPMAGFAEQKRQVTVLYISAADYVTALDAERGSEAARRGLEAFQQMAVPLITDGGGSLFNWANDAILALWGYQNGREDDAERAICAALALQAAFQEQFDDAAGAADKGIEAALSMGLNTGMVLVGRDESEPGSGLSGGAISLANRLAGIAEGDILITHDTYNQVRGLFIVQPAGEIRPGNARQIVRMYRVTSAKPRAFRIRTLGIEGVETRMIGREAELRALTNGLLDVFEDRETHFYTVVGEAGIGKSRLLYEFAKWSELRPEVFWHLQARATPELTDRPYALLRDMLSVRFDILDTDAPEIVLEKLVSGIEAQIGANEEMAHLLGYVSGFDLPSSDYVDCWQADPGGLTRRALELGHRWLIQLCAHHPVVIELEDIHRADDATLDLLASFVRDHPDLPIMIVGLCRPRLFARRAGWGEGRANHHRIELAQLDKRSTQDLVREILQKAAEIPRSLRDLLVDRAEGNPFFLEELVKMLIEDRVIVKDSDAVWRVEQERVGHLPVPARLAGLMQNRLDSLLKPEILTLQRGAVIGRVVPLDALLSLDASDADQVENPTAILAALVDRGYLFRRDQASVAASPDYVFRSKMLQDTLLGTLPASRKAAYFKAAAQWLTKASGNRAGEKGALIARYYAKAEMPAEAADWYTRAGEHAVLHPALSQSRVMFDKALALIEPGDLARQWRALAGRNEVVGQLGDIGARISDDSALLTLANKIGDPRLLAEAYLRVGNTGIMTGDHQKALIALEASVISAQNGGDGRIEALALGLQVICHTRLDDLEAAAATASVALAKAEAFGDQEILARALNNVSVFYVAADDLARAATMVQRQALICAGLGHRMGQVMALLNLGYYFILLGLYEQSEQILDQSLILSEAMGAHHVAAYNRLNLALLAVYQADGQRALDLLAAAQSVLAQVGDSFAGATAQIYAGMALEAVGDPAQASHRFAAAHKEMVVLGMNDKVFDARAGAARCALALQHRDEAAAEAGAVWEHLAQHGGKNLEFPILAYLSCARVFSAAGATKMARQVSERGYQELMDRSVRISDDEWRQSFVSNVPEHRALMALRAGDGPVRIA